MPAGAPGTRIKKCTGLVVDGGATLDLGDLVMERGQRVTGNVRDRDGVPVSGAYVAIQDISSRFGGESSSRLAQCFRGSYRTTTDDEGAFAFDGIEPEPVPLPMPRPPVVQAWHPRAGVSLLAQLSPDDPATVDLVLHSTGAIDGVVEGYRPGYSLAFAGRPEEPERERFASIDKQGRFRFDDVPAGDYAVVLDDHSTSTTVTVRPGETVTAKVVLTSSIVELRVHMHGVSSDQWLVIETEEGTAPERRFSSTVDMGTRVMHCRHLEPGKYFASIDRKTWLPITVAPEPPTQEIEVRVSDGRLLRVARPARRR